MSRRDIPEINAGSMADIAFLLLIFFLVTTTMDIDAGIPRKLPPKQDITTPPPKLKERNVFVVNINKDGVILVNNEKFLKIGEIKEAAKAFLDNGAGKGKNDTFCTYCEGKKSETSSIHPDRAVISIQSSRKTKHGDFIAVTNELVRAYNELRDRESQKEFKESFANILDRAKKNPGNKILKDKVKLIKDRFPMILSESEPIKL